MGPPKEVSPRRRKIRNTDQGLLSRGAPGDCCTKELPASPHQVVGNLERGVRVIFIGLIGFHLGDNDRPMRSSLGYLLRCLQRNDLELAGQAHYGQLAPAELVELLLGDMDLLDLVLDRELIGGLAAAAIES